MTDVNAILKAAYFSTLSTLSYPCYSMMVEDGLTGNYIVYKPTTSNPVAMKGNSVNVTMQVTLVTESMQYNSGDDVDTMAKDVLNVLLPKVDFKLPIGNNANITFTQLTNDQTNDYSLKDKFILIERVLTFQHTIYII